MTSFDLRANLSSVPHAVSTGQAKASRPVGLWRPLLLVTTAHLQQLVRSGVIDEHGFRALARALDAAMQAEVGTESSASALVREVEARVNALLPAELSGAATLGATRVETLAT